MDLETENRIAAILLKEANELRRQAQNEGALAYLRQPALRNRPNSRFLTATVLGVQQANRAVEVNEMWRIRDKQLELERRKASRTESRSGRSYSESCESHSSRDCDEAEPRARASHTSKKRSIRDLQPVDDEGLRDDEMEEFLRSRIRRGRGGVGSRMDETGPYLPSSSGSKGNELAEHDEEPRARVVLGPQKPLALASGESSDDDSIQDKKEKTKLRSSKKCCSKYKLKVKSKDKKKKKRRDEKRKHH